LSPAYRHAAVWLAVIAAASLFTRFAFDVSWAWGVLTAGLLALLAYHVRHLARLSAWLSRPVLGAVPEGSGIWDEALAALHRFERAAARREEQLTEALARFRRAAQALPQQHLGKAHRATKSPGGIDGWPAQIAPAPSTTGLRPVVPLPVPGRIGMADHAAHPFFSIHAWQAPFARSRTRPI